MLSLRAKEVKHSGEWLAELVGFIGLFPVLAWIKGLGTVERPKWWRDRRPSRLSKDLVKRIRQTARFEEKIVH